MKPPFGQRANTALDETRATGVEMALVLPLLVLLIAGVMDLGMLFGDMMSLRQGVGGGSSSCTVNGAPGASGGTMSATTFCLLSR